MRLAIKTTGPAAALAFALALACGESNDPNGPPGIGGGRGGAAGAGGTGGASQGGSSDTGGDAGTGGDGGSALPDAGGGAGTGGYTYQEPPVPEGCPTPTFIPAPGQVIGIQSVHFGRSEVVLRNVSAEPQTIVGGRQGWQWCNVPGYWAIVLAEENIVLAPGQTYFFHLIERNTSQRQLYDGSESGDTNELGIYTTTGAFNNPELIQAFVSWGVGSNFETRESTATMGEKWFFGARIPINPGDAGFVATGEARSGDGFTSVPDRCLPPR